MVLRIRETDYVTSSMVTYPVKRDEVRGHLMIVASGGSGDLEPSFGDHVDPNDAAYSIVDYGPMPVPDVMTAAGRVKTRLKALVDRGGGVEVVGVSGDTIWSDGSTVEAKPAYALGSTVFYDTSTCKGRGRWIIGVNGNHECTQAVGIIYHELAHAFRGHGGGDPAVEEGEAVDDENDLRDALGLVRRDRVQLAGGCDCPGGGCCIVASVAYGSPYAADLNRLRRIRDHRLRATALGNRFFDALHAEYYAFSVEVCRTMVRSAEARVSVERWLVRPLVSALELAEAYTSRPGDPVLLGEHFLAGRESADMSPLEWQGVATLLDEVAAGRVPPVLQARLDASTIDICATLARWLPHSPHVVWGIVEPLRLYTLASGRFAAAADPKLVGEWLAGRIEHWLAGLPLDRIMEGLDPEQRATELAALSASLRGPIP